MSGRSLDQRATGMWFRTDIEISLVQVPRNLNQLTSTSIAARAGAVYLVAWAVRERPALLLGRRALS